MTHPNFNQISSFECLMFLLHVHIHHKFILMRFYPCLPKTILSTIKRTMHCDRWVISLINRATNFANESILNCRSICPTYHLFHFSFYHWFHRYAIIKICIYKDRESIVKTFAYSSIYSIRISTFFRPYCWYTHGLKIHIWN